MAVRGDIFIDCSGDGDLAHFAGAPFEVGDADGNMLYPTMMFRLNGVDPQAAGEAWKTIPTLMDEAEKRGAHFPRKGAIVRPMKHETEWRVNVTQLKTRNGRAIDGTDARELSAGESEGRRQALAFFEFLKANAPGFASSYVVDIPPQLGIRETRRITGRYALTRDDVISCASFRRHDRRQRLADRSPCRGRRDLGLAGYSGLARLQSPALSHAAAAQCREPAGGRPLRLDDA